MSRKIAFQGEPGAFSHAAVHQLFPNDEALPCPSFEDTIAAVQQGRADFGVVPVENSLYGRITDIYHLLPASGLHIVAEHFLRIEMNLLGIPGATLKDIKAVQSLSVALGNAGASLPSTDFGRSVAPTLRARPARSPRQVTRASPPSPPVLPPKSMGSPSLHPISRMPLTTPPVSSSFPPRPRRLRPIPARSRPLSCSACATCRRRSTRRWAGLPPIAST